MTIRKWLTGDADLPVFNLFQEGAVRAAGPALPLPWHDPCRPIRGCEHRLSFSFHGLGENRGGLSGQKMEATALNIRDGVSFPYLEKGRVISPMISCFCKSGFFHLLSDRKFSPNCPRHRGVYWFR